MRVPNILYVGLAALSQSGVEVHATQTPLFALSAGFTSDMVLQREPARAAVYGLTTSDGAVSVAVLNHGAEQTQLQRCAFGLSSFLCCVSNRSLPLAATGEQYNVTATQSADPLAGMCSAACLAADEVGQA